MTLRGGLRASLFRFGLDQDARVRQVGLLHARQEQAVAVTVQRDQQAFSGIRHERADRGMVCKAVRLHIKDVFCTEV